MEPIIMLNVASVYFFIAISHQRFSCIIHLVTMRTKEKRVRFSLQDVKKQVRRRGDELSVSLHFLHPGELHSEIERLITYYERLLGRPQRQCSLDDARACIGDYRLAHCLVATLSAWYTWQQRDWAETLQCLGSEELASTGLHQDHAHALESAGISSPLHLRLVLFNHVNEHHQGFLDQETRPLVL